ncbi:MAG: cytochrome c biogenesis protein ResB [Bacteriovoracaceae bacterium]|nr:cytochrome c biogenesis protein ResB [Bacteriovoracaceae bacterium]
MNNLNSVLGIWTNWAKQAEKILGHVKFAVVIILVFAICLIYGTFMESYHGTEYANRLVYKSPFFFFIQFLMFLSIFTATLMRLPIKKHLYGFYVLHLGLLLLFAGSFITYTSGLDGSMTLPPNLAVRNVQLNEDELAVSFHNRGIKLVAPMPFKATPVDLNELDLTANHPDLAQIKLIKFYPFSDLKIEWIKSPQHFSLPEQSSRYQLFNDNFSEEITLSMVAESDFSMSASLGLLNVHYMPESMFACFNKPLKTKYILWNAFSGECSSLEAKKIKPQKTKEGKVRITLLENGDKIQFFPESSPLPMNDKMESEPNKPWRIFGLELFEKKPHLFTFGKHVAYYSKDEKKWLTDSFDEKPLIELPWMGFQLKLLNHHTDLYPVRTPTYVKPIQDGGQLVSGGEKAVLLKIKERPYWVKVSDGPNDLLVDGEKITLELKKKELVLPFELNLERFKMDTDPGTNNPASYESFVSVFAGNGNNQFHIYMNNPLKYDLFTFYQASYFEAQEGQFGSVLSVNYDPGRFWKYLGSLLLVFGSLWHFVLRNRKKVA